jgi:membrane protease YdiL (CAAX protease family)
MSFVSLMRTGRLPEKPWRVDAIVRLGASVVVCCLLGGVITMAFLYFGASHKTSALLFIAPSAGAIGSFAGALAFLARPWPFENYLRQLIGLLICIYAGFLLMWLAGRQIADKTGAEDSIVTMLITVLTFQGAALVLVHFFLRQHHTGWAEGFGFRNNPPHALLLGLCAGLIAVPVTWEMQIILGRVLESLTFHPHEQEAVEILRNTEGWPNRLALGIATIVIAPIAEEILFRGILYPTIKRIGYPRLALWSTSIFFGAIHVNLAAFVPLTLLAITLIWLYEYTGNLLACITTHCLFNAANFVALYLSQK